MSKAQTKFTWVLNEDVFKENQHIVSEETFANSLTLEEMPNETEHYTGDYELMYAYRELDYFMDGAWEESEFHSESHLSWIPKNMAERMTINAELETCMRQGLGLPLKTRFHDLNDAVPIDKRKKPIFIVCSPSPYNFSNVPNPFTTLQNFDGCENCNAYHDQTDPERFRYLFCAFPLPYCDLPEVPEDTAELPRDSLFILCLDCLHQRFIRVCGYRTLYQNTEWEKPIWPTKYLPYKKMFGVDMLDALFTESTPPKWQWRHHPEGAHSAIPFLTGFYTLANTIIPSMKKAVNFQ